MARGWCEPATDDVGVPASDPRALLPGRLGAKIRLRGQGIHDHLHRRTRRRGSEGHFLPRLKAQDVSNAARSRISPHSLRLTGIARKDATITMRPAPHAGQALAAGSPATVGFGSVAGSD